MIKNLAIFDCVRATAGPQRRERGVESVPFKAKNDAQTASELFKINFQKVQKKGFFYPENGQNDPLRDPNFDINF